VSNSSDGAARHNEARDALATAGLALGMAALSFGKALAAAVAEDLHSLADKLADKKPDASADRA
jgi:hypothetical protein